ncbi:MAG: ferritin family protein [Deltaproteobacteria bacterium]|jgi:rubrerythrin|nr:ferritin family protein [Deltaproteobacteria bacterium]
MQTIFNAAEIFEMAIAIERKGRAFYLNASKSFDEPEVKSLLKGLAEMEKEHEEVFLSLKEKLIPDEGYVQGYDPDNVAVSYVRAMTSGEVFDKNITFEGGESIEEVLKKGIQAEKNSIIFYTGLKGLVPEDLGRANVDRIIREEMKHIVLLTEMLAALKG